MKKAKSVKSSSATKTTAKKAAPKRAPKKTPPRTVDEYLARVPDPARNALTKIRAAIRSAVPPEATETISYRMPAFKHKRTLVWYAAFSNHCSLFPTAAVIEAFKDELKGFSTTKGTIHFPTDKPVPLELIKRLVRARVEHSERKKRG
ncbi:MAG: iron chaperone [Candidatus Angelobacter sp.]